MSFEVVMKRIEKSVPTYQNVTCDKCGKTPPEQRLCTDERWVQYDNVFVLHILGGYGMFTDVFEDRYRTHGELDPERTILLCHECAHEFADWLGLDVHNWHTHVPAGLGGTQHPDHHDKTEEE